MPDVDETWCPEAADSGTKTAQTASKSHCGTMLTKFLGLPENLDGTLRKKPGPKCCSHPAVRGGQGMLKHVDPLAEDLPAKRKRTAVKSLTGGKRSRR